MEFPRRRSTEETLSDRFRRGAFVYDLNTTSTTITNNDPDDFSDVFGGPPRSVMSRKVYGDSSTNLYEDVFKSSSSTSVAEKKKNNQNARSLPVFSIPGMMTRGGGGRLGFYDDIFGSDEDDQIWKSKLKTKSKSNSSSVLSAEDLIMSSPPPRRRPPKLRPLKVPSRPDCSPVLMEEHENRHVTSNVPWDCPLIDDFQLMENDFNEIQRSAQYRFSRSASSPETISLNPTSYQSLKVSADDLETNSPPSVVSSLCQDREKSENKSKARENGLLKQNIDEEKLEKKEGDDEEELTSSSGSEEEEEQEEEIASSYVIEINSDRRTYTEESVAIDEAVAWAKEKFQTQNLDNIDRGYQKQSTRPSAAKPFVKREGDN